MEHNIKCVKLDKVLVNGIYPKREHNVRFFYHRTDGCYYMYDERGCETNLSTCGQLIDLDRELIVGPESLDKNTLVHIGLEASYANPHEKLQHRCNCHPTYIGAWTYLEDIQKFFEGNGIKYDHYKLRLETAPIEGGNCYCYGHVEHNDGNYYDYKFRANTEVSLEAIPKEGYRFLGWKEYHTNEIFSINPKWKFTIKKNMHLIGVFEQIPKEPEKEQEFTVIANCTPANGGFVSGNKIQYKKDEIVSITAMPFYGYEFVHWLKDGNIIEAATFNQIITSDIEITAVFKKLEVPTPTPTPDPNYYTVNIISSKNDSINYSVEEHYLENTKVSIPITAKNKYEIISVTSNDTDITFNSENNTYEFVITKNTTINVEVTGIYTVTVVNNPQNLRKVVIARNSTLLFEGKTNGSFEVSAGLIQGETQGTSEGYIFKNVTVTSNGDTKVFTNGAFEYNVQEDTTITINYEEYIPPTPQPVKRTITIKTTNGTVGFDQTSSTSQKQISKIVDDGTDVTAYWFEELTTYSKYEFVKWYDEATNETLGTSAALNITVNKDITIVVESKEAEYLIVQKNGAPIPNDTLTFDASGGTQEIDIISNTNWEIE